MAAPSMAERRACWASRDRYWRCLEERAEDAARCAELRRSFEASCPQQWPLLLGSAFLCLVNANACSSPFCATLSPQPALSIAVA
ncbi:cytochrome c oxidase assembly factor 6 homolog isoform X1 [Saccopteryx leptura]|uniref:cytochrome c oxidase assembly factor 6 homolog isoform X1 n=1 Tax=Saccopteryx leptura TaxID=249018 RepID=UPI00339CE0BA